MELNQPHSGGFLKENPSDASDVAHSLDELHRVGPFPQIPEWNDMYEKIVTLVVGHRRIHIEKAVSGIRADVNGDSMLVDGKLSGLVWLLPTFLVTSLGRLSNVLMTGRLILGVCRVPVAALLHIA
ncbi:Lon protease [Echinococcus granulosus]|uniref:Lon protease n=1 Tax=Echinococcus granulosus TaxID=6210 RepID=W6UQW3_ECHGR|nr:Lon protease [Echinococcus granulosus]EUB60702.1 Lon protease [Echinococcus granulosus]